MPHNLKRDLTSEELRKAKRVAVSVSTLFRHQFHDLAKQFPRPEPQVPLPIDPQEVRRYLQEIAHRDPGN